MQTLSQSPTDPAFVQNPYPFYETARAAGPFFRWADYDLICTTSYAAANAIFRDRRFGREVPAAKRKGPAPHTAPFYGIEAHSMLELEPPRHTRLRALVLRAFTSRRIAALEPEIASLSHSLIDSLPAQDCDLLRHFGQRLPVIIIARLLGVPESMADDLLSWSRAMVGMYMAGRTRADEVAAATAATEFSDFLRGYIDRRRTAPADDLITHLIAAEEDGAKLSTDELITTCILLLNAGHEATVHSIGNGVKTLLETGTPLTSAPPHSPIPIEAVTEELLRFDPPLHLFTRHAYASVEISGQILPEGCEVALLLGAINRDPGIWDNPERFAPGRPVKPHLSFGAGLHFCLGAPLARLELNTALPILFARLPDLRLSGPPRYGDVYHFHGLSSLKIQHDPRPRPPALRGQASSL